MRERGLKCAVNRVKIKFFMSLPMRERGLKLRFCCILLCGHIVAPHAGAWIEMESLTGR